MRSSAPRGDGDSVHRRVAHARRRRRRRRSLDLSSMIKPRAGARRTAVRRRDDLRRVPANTLRSDAGARAALSAGDRRRADGRADDRDPARAARRSTPRTTTSPSTTRRSKPPRRSPRAIIADRYPARQSDRSSSMKPRRPPRWPAASRPSTSRDVAAVVSRWTGIPQGTITDAQTRAVC